MGDWNGLVVRWWSSAADETSAFPGGWGGEVAFESGRRDVGVPGASTTLRSLSDVI
jgi:hypothetical protein